MTMIHPYASVHSCSPRTTTRCVDTRWCASWSWTWVYGAVIVTHAGHNQRRLHRNRHHQCYCGWSMGVVCVYVCVFVSVCVVIVVVTATIGMYLRSSRVIGHHWETTRIHHSGSGYGLAVTTHTHHPLPAPSTHTDTHMHHRGCSATSTTAPFTTHCASMVTDDDMTTTTTTLDAAALIVMVRQPTHVRAPSQTLVHVVRPPPNTNIDVIVINGTGIIDCIVIIIKLSQSGGVCLCHVTIGVIIKYHRQSCHSTNELVDTDYTPPQH